MDTVWEEASANLRCLLVALQGGQILLPNSLVVEVLPFATPLRIETAPHWVVGAMLWRNLTTPLISLGRLIFRVAPEADLNSRIIIFDEPTRGMDVGAKEDVIRIVKDLRDRGVAILVLSTEPETILTLADRVSVLRKGMVAKEFNSGTIHKADLLAAA